MGIDKRRSLPKKHWKQPECEIMRKRRLRWNKYYYLREHFRKRDGFVYCGICEQIMEDEMQITYDHTDNKPHDGGNPKRCGVTCLSWKTLEHLVKYKKIQPAHLPCNIAKPSILRAREIMKDES